ncbi:MAG TPA: cytochrome d ubiquinol oxidase subunit II [Candidatus Dormibacteraeota bacterium]|nr:cytochrome d ubiquinol oxidase subunit II [Candidatus Dormibacteraeota bacterium]
MWLGELWFALFVAIVAGYLVLDGFDLGVGMLLPFVARDDTERRVILNSIGPIWDGNEVWLVVAGGVLFAAFPIVYAALLSGFYWAMMLLLIGLILRAVAIEFRGKRTEPAWRTAWDIAFFGSSLALAVLLGVAFGNVVSGVPLNASGQVVLASFLDVVHPFALLFGLVTVAMLGLYGAVFLVLKTEGAVQARARRAMPPLAAAFAVLGVIAVVWMAMAGYGIPRSYQAHPWLAVVPAAAVAATAAAGALLRRGRDVPGFFWSAAAVALLLVSLAAGLYPDLLTSTIDARYSMTVSNASAAAETLTVMLVVVAIGLPFVLLYTAGVQYLFRGKVRLTAESY